MTTFRIPERFNASNADDIERELHELIRLQNPERLIFDFSGTIYISSAGLRVVLIVWRQIKKSGGALILHNLTDEVANVFDTAGFSKVMDIRAEGQGLTNDDKTSG